MKIVVAGLIAAASLLLAGCGFELRGTGGSGVLPFSTLYIENTGIGLDLRRRLARSGATTIVDDRKAAEAVVQILGETRDRQILSLNSQGRVREYTLNYRVNFRVADAAGRDLRPAETVVVQRTLSFNESQVLAKEGEEQTLYRDMQNDMVTQLLRRIQATRPALAQHQPAAPQDSGQPQQQRKQ